MDDSAPTMPGPEEDKPLLFISHRHEDKTIADVLRTFIISRTANRVSVFQSSSAAAEGAHAGGPLNKQLMDVLWQTDVYIWLYTDPTKDWSYCSWEYGVALDDHKPDARPILFQFSDRHPGLFADQLRVDVRKREDIEKFTMDLLTAADFFPNHPGAITGFSRESEEVKRAGEELHESLLALSPEEGDEPVPWPPYPYLRLAIDLDQVARICEAPVADRAALVRDVIEKEAIVIDGDAESGRLLGRRAPIENTPFGELLARWRERFPDSETRWVDAICSQISSAVMDDFPTLAWELMRATDPADGTWYGPALIKVQKAPRHHSMRFDVCFLKFALDQDEHVVAGVPKA